MLQTYLQKRSNGYYYFRWVCPPAIRKLLGKREIIKSLRTSSKIQALARAGAYYMAVNGLKEVSLRTNGNQIKLEDALQMLEGIYSQCYEACVVPSFNSFLKLCGLYSAPSLSAAQKKRQELLELVNAHRTAATNRLGEYQDGLSIFDHVEKILEKVNKFFEDKSPLDYAESLRSDFNHLSTEALYSATELSLYSSFAECAEIFSGSDEWYDRFIYDLTQVLFHSYEIKEEKLDPSAAMPLLSFTGQVRESAGCVVNQPANLLPFSKLFEEFLAYKISTSDLSLHNQKEYRNYFEVVVRFIGDLPVETITKGQVKDCLNRYATLPKRNKKPYNTMLFEDFLVASVPDVDRVSPKTVSHVKKMLQSVFRYAIDQGYISLSPAVDLNLGIKQTKNKGPFSKSEIGMLLQAANALNGKYEERKWIVLLGAYTGARLGEITQLRREDLKVDSDTGIKYLRITSEAGSVKTNNANRLVPLHSKLLELGFEVFASSLRDDGRLFPAHVGKSKKITSWFPSFVSELGIPKLNDFNQSRTFHSFRHSFITEARGAGQSIDLVQAIVGHEKTSAGLTDTYTGHFTIDKLQPVVEVIIYL
jgi:integrase